MHTLLHAQMGKLLHKYAPLLLVRRHKCDGARRYPNYVTETSSDTDGKESEEEVEVEECPGGRSRGGKRGGGEEERSTNKNRKL